MVPPLSYAHPPPAVVLEGSSRDILEEKMPFVMEIDEEEFDEEELASNSVRKDKNPVFKDPGVPLDSGSTVGTNLPVSLTDIAESSRLNEASPLLNVSLEEVFRKVLKGEIHFANQENADGFLGDTVERQL
ncbi:hypothetical protein ACOSQ2_013534 [Xanthoceras sorbifolium]